MRWQPGRRTGVGRATSVCRLAPIQLSLLSVAFQTNLMRAQPVTEQGTETTMKLKHIVLAAAVAALAPTAAAEKSIQTWSIQDAMSTAEFQERLEGFQFVWGDTVSGQRVGSTSVRRATNGVNKSDKRACEWALLSALIALKEDAIARGGTSVQGLKSNATGQPFSSTTEFQCITGFTNSRVYLEGEVVK